MGKVFCRNQGGEVREGVMFNVAFQQARLRDPLEARVSRFVQPL
jgi:hypothetical protein